MQDGYDSIGPFHPFVVWAGVLVLDVALACLVLAILAMIGDSIEDTLWPGGFDVIRAL